MCISISCFKINDILLPPRKIKNYLMVCLHITDEYYHYHYLQIDFINFIHEYSGTTAYAAQFDSILNA